MSVVISRLSLSFSSMKDEMTPLKAVSKISVLSSKFSLRLRAS